MWTRRGDQQCGLYALFVDKKRRSGVRFGGEKWWIDGKLEELLELAPIGVPFDVPLTRL